jgi:hypothetical protein
MEVGELIKALEAFDSEMTVIIPRSEGGGLEDVVACYEDIICWEGGCSIRGARDLD